MLPLASAPTENIFTGQGRVQNKSLGSSFEVLESPGPNSDHLYTAVSGGATWGHDGAVVSLHTHANGSQKQL